MGGISRAKLVPTFYTAKYGKDRTPLPSDADCVSVYRFSSGYLRSKGIEHYEIRPYARVLNDHNEDTSPNNKKSRHNQVDWKVEGELYAEGMSAVRSLNGKQYLRPRHLNNYVDWLMAEKETFLI